MHTPSTRILSALAFDRGEESGPRDPIAPHLLEMLSLIERARPVIGEDGPYERARQRRRRAPESRRSASSRSRAPVGICPSTADRRADYCREPMPISC